MSVICPSMLAPLQLQDTAEVWLSDPDRWWRNTVDLITFGLERMLEQSRDGWQKGESAP
jgi:hypothetical protein